MKHSTVQTITRTLVTAAAAAAAVYSPAVLANAYSDAALKGAGVAAAALLTDAGFKLAEEPLAERVQAAAEAVQDVAANVKADAKAAAAAKKQQEVAEAEVVIATANHKTTAPGQAAKA